MTARALGAGGRQRESAVIACGLCFTGGCKGGGGRGPWTREMLIFVHAHASSLSLSLTHLSLARSLSLFICQSIYLSFSSSHHHLHVHHSINICPLSLFSLSLYSHLYHHLDHYLYQFDDMKLRSRNAQTKNVAHFFSSLSFSFFNSL